MTAALPFFAPGGRRPDPESGVVTAIWRKRQKDNRGHTLHTQSSSLLKIKEMRTGWVKSGEDSKLRLRFRTSRFRRSQKFHLSTKTGFSLNRVSSLPAIRITSPDPPLQPNRSMTAISRPFVVISPPGRSAPPNHFRLPHPHLVGRRRSRPSAYQRGCRAATVAPAHEAPPLVSPHRYSSRQDREASFRRRFASRLGLAPSFGDALEIVRVNSHLPSRT
jgi:hypothetical protein